MVMAATAASTPINGTWRRTALGETADGTSADATAAAMLPARDQAALRPIRAVRTSRAHSPTVSAAIAGSNTPLTTCTAPFANRTGQNDGASGMTTAPIE